MKKSNNFKQIWLFAVVIFTMKQTICAQESLVKFILAYDKGQENFVQVLTKLLKTHEINTGKKYDLIGVQLDEHENEFDKLCNAFAADGTFIIDISWSGYEPLKEIAHTFYAPYLRLDITLSPHLDLLNKYLDARNSSDVALIFDEAIHVDQAIYYWIDSVAMRMVITEKLDKEAAARLRDLRPTPNAFAIMARASNLNSIYNQLISEQLLKLPERWNLVVLDFEEKNLHRSNFAPFVNILYLDQGICCGLLSSERCDCSTDTQLFTAFINAAFDKLLPLIEKLIKVPQIGKIRCNDTKFSQDIFDVFKSSISDTFSSLSDVVISNKDTLRINARGAIETVQSNGKVVTVAKYSKNHLEVLQPKLVKPVKPFYRIGTTFALPWSYEEVDPATGQKVWTGYCIDFAARLAESMQFDYELVIPKKGTFGRKDEVGHWDGVIGDLARGETDIVIAALIMTADREEVIDFVAPYFEQVGITIVMRKPVRKTSLFKFMTVLKLEVWLSIVGALVATGFMIWFLDKYSPYSARNNKKAYPYPTRHFNLKESFWFALTSFTPQGGGEAPKALSGRTLVAAYWLFVVLMLATFTANLAAFLTVERMQTPVQSLEQLARQSRINYTVVENSNTHEYFINMKNAEDTLYRLWKELTLNASTDNSLYRVWDYPIREQYGQILIAINDSMPVKDAKEGFDKVNERLNADFAFIHDSAEVKYEITRNCNLTEVGEVFGERPYAIAIQQGSHLQDLISIQLLEMQKDRFFESLQAKYWNNSLLADCASADDEEGITLESLGGVFIATLFGLVLAMITLAGEVFYYNQKKKKRGQPVVKARKKEKTVNLEYPEKKGAITISETFKPVISTHDNLRVTHLTLYPRPRNRLPIVD